MRLWHLACLGGSVGRRICNTHALLPLISQSQYLLTSCSHAQLHQLTGTENGLVDSVAGSTAEQPRLPHANALKNHYETLVQSQALKPDAQQRACVAQLNTLCNQLMAYSQRVDDFEEQSEKYQVRLASLRAELKCVEAEEELARKQQQEAQQSTIWAALLKRVQPQKAPEQSPQEAAFLTAKARERKLQEILGPPPVPPPSPKGQLQLTLSHPLASVKAMTMKTAPVTTV